MMIDDDGYRFLRKKLETFLKSQHFSISEEALNQHVVGKAPIEPPAQLHQNPFGIQKAKHPAISSQN